MTEADDAVSSVLTVAEAAELVGVHHNTIRRAIKNGELAAHMPLGRDPRRAGNFGYRIARAELLRWYAGQPASGAN